MTMLVTYRCKVRLAVSKHHRCNRLFSLQDPRRQTGRSLRLPKRGCWWLVVVAAARIQQLTAVESRLREGDTTLDVVSVPDGKYWAFRCTIEPYENIRLMNRSRSAPFANFASRYSLYMYSIIIMILKPYSCHCQGHVWRLAYAKNQLDRPGN